MIGTTEYVVKNHLRIIFDKLRFWNRAERALWYEARRHAGLAYEEPDRMVAQKFHEPSDLLVAVNCLHRESRQTDGNILCATLSRGGILDPLAGMCDDRLA